MRKDRLYILGSLVLVGWLGMTYFIFLHGPKSENRISERAGWKLKKEIEHFEKRLKAQVKDNSLLLQQVQELRDQKELEGEEGEEEPIAAAPIEKQFVDGANEYDAAKVDLNKDAVDAEQSGSAGRNAEELPAEKVAPVVPPGDVMPVLMFACNRVTVTKALDLILKYRTNKEKFPVIVSQVEFDNRSTEVLMLGIICFCFFFQDCGHPATRSILEGYGDDIVFIQQPDLSEPVVPPKEKKFKGYFKIARHYGWALNQTFNVMNYEQVIVVEDDLEVSPDFFEYFEATLPILKEDKSLFCVSAWNDNGKSGLINEEQPDLLYRSDFFGGLGWMLTKDLWRELGPKWAKSYWDDWIRDPPQRRDRACIRPEISRTKTFGKVGVSNGLFYEKHLKFIKLNEQRVEFTKKDLSYLKKSSYDANMSETLNRIPVVSIEEVQSGAAAKQHTEVRLLYYTKLGFKKMAKVLGIMDDFKAGVPRMAYKGVVSVMHKGMRVHVAPSLNWKGYDRTW